MKRNFLFCLALLLPICAFADDFYTSELSNNSSKTDGYYLVQDSVWSEKGCVADSGAKRLNPGETTTLKIKKDCKWGVVKYQIHKVQGGAAMGYLAHSFHGKNFSLEITAACKNKCVFRDLNPEQGR